MKKGKLIFHKDFESQKNHEIESMLKRSPGERIIHVVELIKRIYSMKEIKHDKKLRFNS